MVFGKKVRLIIFWAIVVAAAVLRLYHLGSLPAGLFCDEASVGYNAYTILKTAKDEHGRLMPLYFRAFGEYKNPVYIYASVPFIAILGLNEMSVRLAAASFGILTVIFTYLLAREMFDWRAGLIASLLLAVSPWSIQFSRMAFELVSLPCFFTLGLLFIHLGLKKSRWWLPVAGVPLGIAVYTYAVARLFLPLFLAGFIILYARALWRRRSAFLLLVLVLALVLIPQFLFMVRSPGAALSRFDSISIFSLRKGAGETVEMFWNKYRSHFRKEFLFKDGDPITRHSPSGVGLLYPVCLPALVAGVVCVLVRRRREGFIILWWIAIYPVAASLTQETPTATRTICGIPAFELLAACGFYGFFLLVDRLRARWLRTLLNSSALAGFLYFLIPEVNAYIHEYFTEYPKYCAGGSGDFQYGYRDVIGYMEQHGEEYDLLMLTATSVNQPAIFIKFYTGVLPGEQRTGRARKYRVSAPEEYRRYPMDKKILYSLRERDLEAFSDYEVKKKVVDPGGAVEFVIAEVRARKKFINDWLVLGLFDNADQEGRKRDFLNPSKLDLNERHKGKYGEIEWKSMRNQFTKIDFNSYFRRQATDTEGNPEHACAYVLAYVHSPVEREAVLEARGSNDHYSLWLNKRGLVEDVYLDGGNRVVRTPIWLNEGPNEILIKSCEDIGDWFLLIRLTDRDGGDLTDTTVSMTPPASGMKKGRIIREVCPRAPRKAAARVKRRAGRVQLVDGFIDVVEASNSSESYVDHRENARSWWEYFRPVPEVVRWRTSPCPKKMDTVFVFTAQTGENPGKAHLLVDGKAVLDFETGHDRDGRWGGGGYVLAKRARGFHAGNCGVYLLFVPASEITPGRPCELEVTHYEGAPAPTTWFMIKDYTDTISYEGIDDDTLTLLFEEGDGIGE